MAKAVFLFPIGSSIGVTNVSLGLVHAFQRQNIPTKFFKPIAQRLVGDKKVERSIACFDALGGAMPPEPLSLIYAEQSISKGGTDAVLERIISTFTEHFVADDLVVVEGLVATEGFSWADNLNIEMARALDAQVVFVTSPGADEPRQLREKIEIYYNLVGGVSDDLVAGVIVNKAAAPIDQSGRSLQDITTLASNSIYSCNALAIQKIFVGSEVPLLGAIEWNREHVSPRAHDVSVYLNATVVSCGDLLTRRVKKVAFCDGDIYGCISQCEAGTLLVISMHRSELLLAAALVIMNGVQLAGLLLTGGVHLQENILPVIQPALDTGLPVLAVEETSLNTIQCLQAFSLVVPLDDIERSMQIQDFVADALDKEWLDRFAHASIRPRHLAPAAFRYQLVQMAKRARKTIILPEGEELRTIRAAVACCERELARCILVGDRRVIETLLEHQGLSLSEGLDIVDPASHRERLVPSLVAARKHKGMTDTQAREELQDNVMLATLMLKNGEVDGLVSGAVHTTANTIRPALQLIKTRSPCALVSSIFFMLLKDQVKVFGDCAVVPNPSAEQLADIGIQAAESAKQFGLDPKVAFISYSTGSSGIGKDVDKVREAVGLVRSRCPQMIVDGPLQYDAAVTPSVARVKAPDSLVAGLANVLIFPDLNTGNTTYKAVQRAAGMISIGPMLQGLAKPVNDLSRGASVDDIIFTIAITAIQSSYF